MFVPSILMAQKPAQDSVFKKKWSIMMSPLGFIDIKPTLQFQLIYQFKPRWMAATRLGFINPYTSLTAISTQSEKQIISPQSSISLEQRYRNMYGFKFMPSIRYILNPKDVKQLVYLGLEGFYVYQTNHNYYAYQVRAFDFTQLVWSQYQTHIYGGNIIIGMKTRETLSMDLFAGLGIRNYSSHITNDLNDPSYQLITPNNALLLFEGRYGSHFFIPNIVFGIYFGI
jgi:hypothetical protein